MQHDIIVTEIKTKTEYILMITYSISHSAHKVWKEFRPKKNNAAQLSKSHCKFMRQDK